MQKNSCIQKKVKDGSPEAQDTWSISSSASCYGAKKVGVSSVFMHKGPTKFSIINTLIMVLSLMLYIMKYHYVYFFCLNSYVISEMVAAKCNVPC